MSVVDGSAVTGSRPNVWQVGEHADDAANPRVTEILGVLAHEFRNPLASLQGCAQTLVQRGDDLPADVRRGLAEVIAKQSQRMDWLIRASAAFGGLGGGRREQVDISELTAEAAAFADVPFRWAPAATVEIDRTRARLAIEAVMLALGGPDATVGIAPDGTTVEVDTSDVDLDQGSRRWKLQLAARLLRGDGGRVIVERSADGIRVELCLHG